MSTTPYDGSARSARRSVAGLPQLTVRHPEPAAPKVKILPQLTVCLAIVALSIIVNTAPVHI